MVWSREGGATGGGCMFKGLEEQQPERGGGGKVKRRKEERKG